MTTATTLGVEPARIGNPHRVPERLDQVLPVRRDVPGYGETCFLTTWNPTDGVGLFLHAGRCPQDVDLWWAQSLAYLPGGKIAVDRSWGRSRDGGAIQTGNFTIRMDNPLKGWTSTFDGAGEITTAATMVTRPSGAGPARPMRWELATEAAGPVWDMYTALGRQSNGSQDWASGTHTQQVLRVRGTLTVDGVEYRLDGTGANDHSSGTRDLRNFGSHHFLIGGFPGRALHSMSIFGMDGAVLLDSGSEFGEGEDTEPVTLTDVPPLAGLDATPLDFEATLNYADGTKTAVRLEVLHTAPISINTDNDNINGVDWDSPDTLFLSESRVRMTLPDGTVGFAHLERSCQRSTHAAS
ncbi:MAG: hypothetical protein QOE32_4886 [Pseudonocardiales bacterium]|nr:hypothetical protein [Pseudonocardiales bacterium]MDT7660915.1 hypothetical protein [Pseudonocardiales bacterium]MDT7682395.1 hypothetical protein [Pseudonocardiales bacterium]